MNSNVKTSNCLFMSQAKINKQINNISHMTSQRHIESCCQLANVWHYQEQKKFGCHFQKSIYRFGLR